MNTSFYTADELMQMGFSDLGSHVQISRKASFYRAESISLGNHVRIDDFCILSGGSGIHIGNYVHISPYSAVYGGSEVVMEDYTGLSPRCIIFSESDDFSGHSMIHPFFPDQLKPGYIRGRVILRKFVQLGAGTTVLPGIEMKTGSVTGAHSLVTKSCDEWGIYAGIPAVYIKKRSRKLLELEKRFRESVGNGECHE